MPKLAKRKPEMRTKELVTFIIERENIRVKKERGEPKPWTDNPILRDWKFCNVEREQDTETKWIAKHWVDPNADDPDLIFAVIVARFVNLHPSLDDIGYPVPWKSEHFVLLLRSRMTRNEKCFSSAYQVQPHAPKGQSKGRTFANVFSEIWLVRRSLRNVVKAGSLAGAHRLLMEFKGLGSFMAAQVVADLKYVEPLKSSDDWETWAAMGPGSKRGLNRVFNRPKNQDWSEFEWFRHLTILRSEILPMLKKTFPALGELHAQDLQNCLCEFDKYERMRLGEGHPRQRYAGK